MDKKLGQEPAFAALNTEKTITSEGCVTEYYMGGNNGISTRLYIATRMMQGILSNSEITVKNAKDYAEMAFDFADELLKQDQNV